MHSAIRAPSLMPLFCHFGWTAQGLRQNYPRDLLLVKSQALADKLQDRFNAPVALSMRYGKPSIADGPMTLHENGVTRVCIVPLYPHYATHHYHIMTSAMAHMPTVCGNVRTFTAPAAHPGWGRTFATICQPTGTTRLAITGCRNAIRRQTLPTSIV